VLPCYVHHCRRRKFHLMILPNALIFIITYNIITIIYVIIHACTKCNNTILYILYGYRGPTALLEEGASPAGRSSPKSRRFPPQHKPVSRQQRRTSLICFYSSARTHARENKLFTNP